MILKRTLLPLLLGSAVLLGGSLSPTRAGLREELQVKAARSGADVEQLLREHFPQWVDQADALSPDLARYLVLKRFGGAIPADLQARLFPAGPARDGRQGGDGPGEATPIEALPYEDSGTTVGYTNDVTNFSGPDVFYGLSVATLTFVTASLCGGTAFDSGLSIYFNDNGALGALVASSDDFCGSQSEIPSQALSAGDYFIVVDGWGGNSGNYTLSVFSPGDPCEEYNAAVQTATAPCTLTGSTTGAPSVYGGAGGDAGMEITIPTAGLWNFDACQTGTSFDVVLYLFDQNPCDGGSLLATGAGSNCTVPWGAGRLMEVNLEPGTYHLMASHTWTTTGSFEVVVEPTPPRPTQGGPDEMGYAWINSQDPAGPEYDWVDISATGIDVPLSDDSFAGPFAMGIDFPFYEDVYNQCWIGSNGYVSFSQGYSALGSQPYPTPPDGWSPDNFVGLFWDDLWPVTAGSVRYLSDPANGRFIVQFTNVPGCCSDTNPLMTFQGIFYENGSVRVNFNDMGESDLLGFSAGMENTDGTIGLQYNYHGEGGYVGDQSAVDYLAQEGDFRPPMITLQTIPTDIETELPGGALVEALITDETGVASAIVHYTVNGGAEQTAALTQGAGDLWAGSIPHQAAGSTVSWFLRAVDSTEEGNARISASYSFEVVSYTWAPLGLTASDGNPMQTTISWLPPVDPGLLAQWFGATLPRDLDEGLARLMQEHGQSKELALATWQSLFSQAGREFIQYRVYRDGELIGTTGGTAFGDNATHDSEVDVVYSYTVRALFDAGESDPSNADTGFWTTPTTPSAGGPDNYGYTWVSTPNPNAPDYAWVEISGIGTNLGITGDDSQGTLTLPWAFPWYEASYSTIYISSNGYVSFQPSATIYWNSIVPNVSLPNNSVYALWDDLYVTPGTSAIYYYNDAANQRVIFQWDQVTPLGSPTTPHTFEIILYQNGQAVVNYDQMSATQVQDATVGIENADGTDGLNANTDNNGMWIDNQITVLFRTPVGPTISHTPLPDIETELPGGYAVSAQIMSELTVSSALVSWTVNGGAPQSVALAHGAGDTWTGAIAHQNAGSLVNYHLEATDSNGDTRVSQSWTFDVVSYHNPPLNLIATEGLQLQTNISWLPPAGIGLSTWFGQDIPGSEDEAVARLVAEHGMSKAAAAALWRQLILPDERVFIQYKLYRDGQLLTSTTGTTFVDNAGQGSEPDVTYTYTVTAQYTAGESNPSIADTGYWGSPPTFGGPDAFGYLWTSSLHPAGPDYNWTDISVSGTVLALTGDDAAVSQTIPFQFPWYGNFYTTLYVSTNGYVTFQPTATPYWNGVIPDPALPNDVVFAMWDDLYVGQNGSAVYYLDDAANQRAIFQWNNVTPLGNSAAPHTFQIILSASGIATIQYEDITESEVLDISVGCEDAAGTIGLQVNANGEGLTVTDALALTFLPPSNCEPVECAGIAETEPNEGWGDNNQSWNPIHCGETRCGTVLANGAATDTDWYLYTHFGGNISVDLQVSDFDGRVSLRQQALNGQTIASAGTFPRCFDEAFTINDLASGAYYLVVEHTGAADVTTPQTYSLTLTCGGDPCSGHQPIECAGTAEVEPNEGWNAVPPNGSYGEITLEETVCGTAWANGGVRDMDWFHFSLATPASVVIDCQIDAFDAALFLTDFDPAGGVLAEVDDAPACAPESITYPNLPAGDYFVVIGHNSADGVPDPQPYALHLGLPGGPEDPCDNYVDAGDFHDIWSATRPSPMNTHHDGTGCPGVISTPGRDEVLRLVLAQTTDLQVTMHGEGQADEAILLLGNCAQPGTSCGASVNAFGANAGSEILTLENLPAGDYFLVADFVGVAETHPYFLSVVDMESGLGEGRALSFQLEPAHPNPFNPTTTIAWTQPGLAQATLSVHDLRGALVEELDLGLRGAGRHSIVWDGSRLGSGVYFYTLTAGQECQTRKAVLVK